MNDSTPQPLKEQLNINEVAAILAGIDEWLAEQGLVIIRMDDRYIVANHTPKAYVGLSHHNTLTDAYKAALTTATDGAIWEAMNGNKS